MRASIWALISGSIVMAVGVLALACDSSSEARVDVQLDPLRAVVATSRADAASMERHADAMAAALGSRAGGARWASDQATLRANARSLRALADWGAAILHSEALYPPGSTMVDLDRLQGDGLSLQSLAETVMRHASAMQALILAMRADAGGDAQLLMALDALEQDAGRMSDDGAAALAAGKALVERAREFARSIGKKLD